MMLCVVLVLGVSNVCNADGDWKARHKYYDDRSYEERPRGYVGGTGVQSSDQYQGSKDRGDHYKLNNHDDGRPHQRSGRSKKGRHGHYGSYEEQPRGYVGTFKK